jgi:PPOX class probable F420-dependent enzyme
VELGSVATRRVVDLPSEDEPGSGREGETILSDAQAALFLEPNFGWVATIRRDGTPQVSVIWLDWDGERVVFNTAEGRAKPENLRRDPRCTVSVLDRSDPYRWLSVTGTAELSQAGAVDHIDKLSVKYRGRYPYGVPEGEQRVIVRVTPERIRGNVR